MKYKVGDIFITKYGDFVKVTSILGIDSYDIRNVYISPEVVSAFNLDSLQKRMFGLSWQNTDLDCWTLLPETCKILFAD